MKVEKCPDKNARLCFEVVLIAKATKDQSFSIEKPKKEKKDKEKSLN